jgi:hypothetical protein
MKNLWIVAVGVLLICVVCAPANMLKNDGFEWDVGESNWNIHWGNFAREGWNNPPEGIYAGYLTGLWADAGNAGGIIQQVPAEANIAYVLSAYLYTDNKWSAEEQNFKLEFFDADHKLLCAETNVMKDLLKGQWAKRVISLTSPPGTVEAQVVFEATGISGGGVLGIDKVKLEKNGL